MTKTSDVVSGRSEWEALQVLIKTISRMGRTYLILSCMRRRRSFNVQMTMLKITLNCPCSLAVLDLTKPVIDLIDVD